METHLSFAKVLDVEHPPSMRLRKMEMVLGSDTDELLHQLCCGRGWPGDGLTGGVADDEVCWKSWEFSRYARCCFHRLLDLVQAPAPRWMRQELLADWRKDGASRPSKALMDTMEEEFGHLYCRFRIIQGKLYTCDTQRIEVLKNGDGGEPWGQYQAMARAIRIFLALELLPEMDFFVSPNIYDQHSHPREVPVLTKARSIFAEKAFVRVPSYELIGPLLDKMRMDLQAKPWEEKEGKLFWRGGMRSFNRCRCRSNKGTVKVEHHRWPHRWRNFTSLLESGGTKDCSCTRLITNVSNFELSNRVRLCEIGHQHPHLVDAKLSYIPESYGAIRSLAEERQLVVEDWFPPEQQSRFKYLISTDGSTIDDTRIYWMLSSGSLVFKQITPLLPYGLPALEPWKHFVPVKEDFSDLIEKVQWARAHDDLSRAIASRARDFARSFFTEEQILHYIYRVLQHIT
eukprot:symbB.v1.2.008695.t1/scaffold543.1/size336731/8